MSSTLVLISLQAADGAPSTLRVNVLIGVGLLADPLAFADAGWIFGTLILLFCALVTNCKLLLLLAVGTAPIPG